jgi:tetratricopeptide (TPR) repeat protein
MMALNMLEAPSNLTRPPSERGHFEDRLETSPAAGQHRELWIYLLLACVTIGVYLPVLKLDFVNFDDSAYVTSNPNVAGGLTWSGIVWSFRNFHSSNWHPVTWISHMVDCQLYGLRPAGHHLTNALLHIANSLLIFRLLKGMTGAFWRSAFVAGLFALHPLRVESVAWVAERKDVLSGFFGLLTLLAYAKYVSSVKHAGNAKSELQNPKSETNSKSEIRKKVVFYGSAVLFFALGLMSKPMLVTWPLVMLLLDFWPLGRVSSVECGGGGNRANGTAHWVRLLGEKVPFFMLSAGSCVITFLAQRQGGAVVPVQSFPLTYRIENAVMSYVRYIGKLFYPHDMAVVYPKVAGWPMAEVLLSGMLLMIGSLFVLTYWRPGYLVTGWFWFVVTLVPVIGLVKVGDVSMADRYTYLPAIGLFILITWGICELTSGWSSRSIPLAIGATALLITCAIVTRKQIPYWQNAETLFEHALAVTGKNALADINLGAYFTQTGQLSRAREHYESAITIDPNFAEPWNGLGYILAEENRYNEAIPQYEMALQLKPGLSDTRINFGKALFQVGMTDAAIEQFREAVRLKPSDSIAHYNLGYSLFTAGDIAGAVQEYRSATDLNPKLIAAWYNFGRVLALQNKADEAMACYRKALEIDPGDMATHEGLGELLLSQGKNEEAAKEFSIVLRKNADDLAAHYQLALALTGQGKSREAVEHYRRGLESVEENPVALNNLAWILATYPDPQVRNGSEAVTLAEKACNLTQHKQAIFVGTLAAAYAEVGRFADALATAEKARALAEAAGSQELVANNVKLMQLYRAGKPFRDVP